MNEHPFPVLRKWKSRISVGLFTKEDPPMNDDAVAAALGVKEAAALWQVHGGKTIVVRGPLHRTEKADGMVSEKTDLALCIRAADCQNFVCFVPERNVIGAFHAGWRGLLAGVIPEFFRVLREEWDIAPREVILGAGPSLCLKCALYPDYDHELRQRADTRYIKGDAVDLRLMADDQLFFCGVLPENYDRMDACTCCDPEKFWTYRGGDREAVENGRTNTLAIAMLS